MEDLPGAERGVGEGGAGGDDLAVFAEGGPEAAAAGGVEFSEDVVGEEERLHAGADGEVFDFSEAEGEGEAALLSLGGELACRFSGYGEFAVVAVRTGKGGLHDEVAGAVTFEEGGPGGGVGGGGLIGRVGERGGFGGVVGELGVRGGDVGAERGDAGGAEGGEGSGGVGEGTFEGGEFSGGGGAFEEGVTAGEGAVIRLERVEINGIGRGEGEVEPAAAGAGGAADEELILRGENDGGELTEVVDEAWDTFAVAGDFFAAGAEFDEDAGVAAALVGEFAGDGGFRLAVRDEGAVVGGAEGAEGEEKTGGFEEVGFSLGVGADEEMAVAGEREVGEGDVAEILKRDPAEAHQRSGSGLFFTAEARRTRRSERSARMARVLPRCPAG